jgi:hypothetical protein
MPTRTTIRHVFPIMPSIVEALKGCSLLNHGIDSSSLGSPAPFEWTGPEEASVCQTTQISTPGSKNDRCFWFAGREIGARVDPGMHCSDLARGNGPFPERRILRISTNRSYRPHRAIRERTRDLTGWLVRQVCPLGDCQTLSRRD